MTADVAIVGCGVQGLSVARHLARRGLKVVVLDRVGPGRQTSRQAAGQSVIAQTDPAMGALMQRSIDDIVSFEGVTGIPLRYYQVGSVKYARTEWAADQLRREVERASALGARISMVSLDDAAVIAPHTNAEAAVAAWHAPDDIYFEPTALVDALYWDALGSGVSFHFGVEVMGLKTSRGAARGVHTSRGTVAAGQVVLTAGNWTAPLLEQMTGQRLPLVYVRHQYTIRGGLGDIHPGLPSVRVVEDAVYARPAGRNLMFGTYEPRPQEFDSTALPRTIDELELDHQAIDSALDRVGALFPSARSSFVREVRGGVVTMTPDGSYLIDRARGVDDLFFIAGCNVMGLSVAPALGKDVAQWVVTGEPINSLGVFSLSRFDDNLGDAEVHHRALAEYEGMYRDDLSRPHVRS